MLSSDLLLNLRHYRASGATGDNRPLKDFSLPLLRHAIWKTASVEKLFVAAAMS
jgi:hypothetical protein